MPSSLIFTGLVVFWLLILVPAVARHQQEVARPSGASLAGRVLDRPRRRGYQGRRTGRLLTEEGDAWTLTLDQDDTPTARETERPWVSAARAAPARRGGGRRADEHDDRRRRPEPEPVVADDADDESDVRWERPPPRYRPGRGGYDPDEDAETARARYAFRQRVVLTLLVCALLTGVAAAAAFPVVWWAHGAIDLALVVYLIYLRRQVRMEATIRDRRAARMAGTRRTLAADDRDLDEWARRGREVTRRPSRPRPTTPTPEPEADRAEPDDARRSTAGPTRTTTRPASAASASRSACCPPGDAASTTRPRSRRAPCPRCSPPRRPRSRRGRRWWSWTTTTSTCTTSAPRPGAPPARGGGVRG